MATILEKMQVADIKLVGGLAGSWPAAVGDAGDRISWGWVTGNALQRYERNHVDHSSFHDRRHRHHGAAPNAGAATCAPRQDRPTRSSGRGIMPPKYPGRLLSQLRHSNACGPCHRLHGHRA